MARADFSHFVHVLLPQSLDQLQQRGLDDDDRALVQRHAAHLDRLLGDVAAERTRLARDGASASFIATHTADRVTALARAVEALEEAGATATRQAAQLRVAGPRMQRDAHGFLRDPGVPKPDVVTGTRHAAIWARVAPMPPLARDEMYRKAVLAMVGDLDTDDRDDELVAALEQAPKALDLLSPAARAWADVEKMTSNGTDVALRSAEVLAETTDWLLLHARQELQAQAREPLAPPTTLDGRPVAVTSTPAPVGTVRHAGSEVPVDTTAWREDGF
jgi:hypothetical protein